MQWFDGSDDADPGYFDTRSQITVDQLLTREGFRPTGSRPRRRALTGAAWVAFGAVVGAVLWHQPIDTFLASGSFTDVTPDIAQRPAGGTDPTVLAATRDGATAAVPHGVRSPAVPAVPKPPVLVVIPPSASTVSTKPRSHPHPRLPVVAPAVARVAPAVVTPVAPVTPVTWTQPSFSWFGGGTANGWGGFGGSSSWAGCGGWDARGS